MDLDISIHPHPISCWLHAITGPRPFSFPSLGLTLAGARHSVYRAETTGAGSGLTLYHLHEEIGLTTKAYREVPLLAF